MVLKWQLQLFLRQVYPLSSTLKMNIIPDLPFCQISSLIKQLASKSSFGHDEISNNLIKRLEPLIAEPLALIINQSLSTGIFPDKFKITKITPIYQKDNKHFIENYRPISLLPSISKIFERVVYDQINSY